MALDASEWERLVEAIDESHDRGLLEDTTPESYFEALKIGVNFDNDTAYTYNLTVINGAIIDILNRLAMKGI